VGDPGDRGRGGGSDSSARLWRLSGMGATLASEVAAGALLGWLVDHLSGWSPWGVVVGAIAGLVIGMATFLRDAFRLNRDSAAEGRRHPRRVVAGDARDDGPPDAPASSTGASTTGASTTGSSTTGSSTTDS